SSGTLFVAESFSGAISKFAPDGAQSVVLAGRPPAEPEEEEAESETDSSAGLPDKYAKNYLIARSTISPNKKFAVIYPNEDFGSAASEGEVNNYLVRLEPFAVLRPLDTNNPYVEHESHGGLSAE